MHPRTLIPLTLQIVNTPEQENTLPASLVRFHHACFASHWILTQPTGPFTPPSPPQRRNPRLPQRQYPSNQHLHLDSPRYPTLRRHLRQPCSQAYSLCLFDPRIRLFVHWKLDLGFK